MQRLATRRLSQKPPHQNLPNRAHPAHQKHRH
jgi:hypothetical protein